MLGPPILRQISETLLPCACVFVYRVFYLQATYQNYELQTCTSFYIHAAMIKKDISKYIHNYTSGYRVATKLLYVRLCPLLIIYVHLICANHTAYLNTVQKWGFPQLCEVSRQLLFEIMAYQHIMLFQLEIILCHNQWTMD